MFSCPKCHQRMAYDWISDVVRCQNIQCNFKTTWTEAMNKFTEKAITHQKKDGTQ